jgi:hypothetical protein
MDAFLPESGGAALHQGDQPATPDRLKASCTRIDHKFREFAGSMG